MKNIKFIHKLLAVLVLLFMVQKVEAQQNVLFNTYVYDPLQLNIAYAGNSCNEVNLNYRRQWLGLKDAPLLYQLNAHAALGKNTGFALRVSSQQAGLLNTFQTMAGYAYHMKVDHSTIHFGLGVGFIQNMFDANRAIVLDKDDASLGAGRQKSTGFDSECGVMVLDEKFKAGFSVLHLYTSNADFTGSQYRVLPQFNINLSYVFNKYRDVEIEPWIVNRYTLGSTNTFDAVLNFNFFRALTVGAGIRTNYGMLFFLGLKGKHVKVGYSFDYGTTRNKTIMGSSHQVMLGYGVCKVKKYKQPKKAKSRKVRARF